MPNSKSIPAVFDCEGCGIRVYRFGVAGPPALLFCHECEWLEEIWANHGVEVATTIDQTLRAAGLRTSSVSPFTSYTSDGPGVK